MGTYRLSYASEHGWANGEAASALAGSPATFDPATVGIDIFRSPGELRTGYASTEVGGATVDQNIIHMLPILEYTAASATRSVFAYASGGDLYKITDEATPVVSLLRAVSSSAMGGLVSWKNYLWYSRSTTIGQYGSLAAGAGGATFDDSFVTGLAATAKGVNITHPLHPWVGNGDILFIGDSNLLKMITGSDVTGTTGTIRLSLNAGEVITALNDNGTRLLIGASIEADPAQDTRSEAWLYMYDGTSVQYQDKIKFPENYVHKIEVLDNNIYVFGRYYLYRLVGSSFQIVSPLGARVGPGGTAKNRGQLFWKDNDKIMAIGTPNPQLPMAKYAPYSGTGTDANAICWVQDAKLWVSDTSNLNEYKTGSATGRGYISKRISESQQFMVDEIRVYLSTALASGDDLRIRIYNETGTSTDALTFDFATYGAANSIVLHANQFTNAVDQLNSMQIGAYFNAGAVRLREVLVKTSAIAQR